MAAVATRDAEAYPQFTDFLTRLAAVADPVLSSTPPDIESLGMADELFLLLNGVLVVEVDENSIVQAISYQHCENRPPGWFAGLVWQVDQWLDGKE